MFPLPRTLKLFLENPAMKPGGNPAAAENLKRRVFI
jgi:hypothetical protein